MYKYLTLLQTCLLCFPALSAMEQQTITYTYEEHSIVVDFALPEGAVRARSHSQDKAQQTSPKVQDVTDLCKVVAVQPGEGALPPAVNVPTGTAAELKAELTQELAAAIIADPKTPEEIAAQDARCKKIKMIALILGITTATSAVTAGIALLGTQLQ